MDKLSGVRGILIGALATLVLLAVIGLIVVYTGAYNVAASAGHLPFTRWALDTTMENSVKARAAHIAEPRFTPEMVRAGAAEYKAMCEHCHAGPGVEREEWAQGMLPRPPHLTQAAANWRPREVLWIVKHGIKMSGMPSFGETHPDQALWRVVAFVKELPAMTPETYAAFATEHSKDEPARGPSG